MESILHFKRNYLCSIAWWSFFSLILSNGKAADHPASLTFERDVRPIFKAMCFHCHGEDDIKKGGLDLRQVRLMLKGGESGSALVAGQPDNSLLWHRITSDEMPKGEKKLSSEQKHMVREWILGGSKTARPEPENVQDAPYTIEELEHWAFQPIEPPEIPELDGDSPNNPIDSFIQQKLGANGLKPSPETDKRTLIRRLSFDLRGLPPSPDEVRAFLEDETSESWAHLVDRFLASPHFGERWGRHWLDVAGYAESDGGTLNDPTRPYAWRYRDYVVRSFNRNKPINEFYIEQLAGDERIEGPLDRFNTRHEELLAATGFLQMAPDPTRTSNGLLDRNNAVAETLKVVSSAMLGITVGCAQCHDHKYDPISIDDYYRFRAIFDPAFPMEKWRTHDDRLIDLTPPMVQAEIDRIEAEAVKLENDIKSRRDAVAQEIQERKLADVPEAFRELLRSAVQDPGKERTERQKALLDEYPMVKPIGTIIGLLVEYDAPSYRAFEKEFEKVAEIRATKPDRKMVLATTESPGVTPISKVFFRGNPESPMEEVFPDELTALRLNGIQSNLPINNPDLKTSGRRLAYARHLTNGNHPLTARVFVNRTWMHLLGRGIVTTPGDFGLSGERPSHPELLDWLALEFMNGGWDQKQLIRTIVLSRTYRQTSTRREDLERVDPDNSLFGRANLKRLDAESLRDSMLMVAGLLNPRLEGASLPVTENPEGKTVIGVRRIKDGLKAGVDGGQVDIHRRSLYIQMQRNKPLDMLATFDLPNMAPNCEMRRHTTVATQSLWMLNDEQMVQWSEALARSVCATESHPSDWIEELYERLYSAKPSHEEMDLCLAFIHEQAGRFEAELKDKSKPMPEASATPSQLQAVAALSQTLIAFNRFLYID